MDKQAGAWHDFFDHAELTDVGLRRSNNQDNLGTIIAADESQWRRNGHLLMVADGMGAHNAGELASKMAVDAVRQSYYKIQDLPRPEALRRAVIEANSSIHNRGQSNLDFKGMGTTASVLLVLPEGAVVAHVGDSRAYRLRGNRLEQLSADHSLVWEMMANGKMSESEIPPYVPKNVITRSLGPSEAVQVDLEGPFPLAEGDTFLLCSDGLSGQVKDYEIGVVLGVLPPQEAARVLIELANLRGGPDNITVLIGRVNTFSEHLAAPPSSPPAQSMSNSSLGVNVMALTTLGIATVAAIGLVVVDQLMPAAACAAAALMAGIWATMRRPTPNRDATTARTETGGRYGQGPHRSVVCAPGPDFLDRMSALIEPVCQTAREQGWQINWAPFDEQTARSKAAAAGGDYALAAREFCLAIAFLMHEVREQRRKRGSDTTES